jgi:endoglycosylceramidase
MGMGEQVQQVARGRRGPTTVLGALALLAVLALLAAPLLATAPPTAAVPVGPARAGDTGPTGRISHDGRWLVDADGRVVQVHGVNLVAKFPAEDPPTPAEEGFDADDAAFLREQGFNVVRLGVVFGGVMPEPGVIDQTYVGSIVGTVEVLAAHGIYVLLDMHQDGYGPLTHGNGFPAWATITDGLPNPAVGFPLYYVQNPALQRAFDNFWANVPGPDGVPLQTHYATALTSVAAEVADEPYVLGYDTMNEPWPGTTWQPCVTGCPDLEATTLAPFSARMATAIRSVDADAIVFTEPFVLFNFGSSGTSLSGFGAPASGLSFHVYALSAAEDEAVIDHAIDASATGGDAIVATEFGATTDVATLDRLTGALDTRLVPWMFWAYDEGLVVDLGLPPTGANVRAPVLTALARPYATATNGTPTSFAYDPATRTLDYGYATVRPDGAAAPGAITTVLAMTVAAYPDGYTVEVDGAAIASAPDARELVLCNEPGATEVVVRVTPGADPTPPTPVSCAGVEPPTTTTSTSAPATTSTSVPTVPTVPGDPAPPSAARPVAVRPSFTG